MDDKLLDLFLKAREIWWLFKWTLGRILKVLIDTLREGWDGSP